MRNSLVREAFPFRLREIEAASMTGREGIGIERNSFQADQATADGTRVVEQASMDFAHQIELQPPVASKIGLALCKTNRAEGDHILIPIVTAQTELLVGRYGRGFDAIEGRRRFGADKVKQGFVWLPIHSAEID